MIEKKYGGYTDQSFLNYKSSLINRVWRLIPLREEKCETLVSHIERLNRELNGMLEVSDCDHKYIIAVIHLLENAKSEDDFSLYRADIFRCCDLLQHMGGDEHVVR